MEKKEILGEVTDCVMEIAPLEKGDALNNFSYKNLGNIPESKKNTSKYGSISSGKTSIVIYILFSVFLFMLTECSDKFGKYTYINYKKLKRPDYPNFRQYDSIRF